MLVACLPLIQVETVQLRQVFWQRLASAGRAVADWLRWEVPEWVILGTGIIVKYAVARPKRVRMANFHYPQETC